MTNSRQIHVSRPLIIATSDKSVSTSQRTCPTKTRQKMAPLAKACSALTGAFLASSSPRGTVTRPRHRLVQFRNLIAMENTHHTGSKKVLSGTPILMYVPITMTEIEENPWIVPVRACVCCGEKYVANLMTEKRKERRGGCDCCHCSHTLAEPMVGNTPQNLSKGHLTSSRKG
jgi:hypothetical protein